MSPPVSARERPVVAGGLPLRRTLVTVVAVVGFVLVTVLAFVVQVVLARATVDEADSGLRERSSLVAAAVVDASTRERVVVPAAVLDLGVVVYVDGTLQAGTPPPRLADLYGGLGAEGRTRIVDADDTLRVRSDAFALPSGRRGTVVVAERLEPYQRADRDALLTSLALGLLLTVAAAAVAAWVSRRALAPVAAMAATAEDWSEHDLSRRFGLGRPRDELTTLAATLDGLLEKVAAAIRAEQRLTSELAHELRTPLSAVQGAAELVAMRDDLDDDARADLEEVLDGCRRMARTITDLLDLVRLPSAGRCDVAEVRAALASERPGVGVDVDAAAEQLGVAAERRFVLRVLQPLMDNAQRHAARVRVRVESADGGRALWFHVDDDGPGFGVLGEQAFEPGRSTSGGPGLGLALARRVARTLGGDVTLTPAPDGWSTRVSVRLPSA